MSYSIRIGRSAAWELERVPRGEREQIVEAIDGLAEPPFAGSALKGGLRGLRRLRVGDFLVLYEVGVDPLIVLVVRLANRSGAR